MNLLRNRHIVLHTVRRAAKPQNQTSQLAAVDIRDVYLCHVFTLFNVFYYNNVFYYKKRWSYFYILRIFT